MLLTITVGTISYQFEISLHSDNDKEYFCLAILFPEKSVLIARKELPDGDWYQIEGGGFDADLEDAIYNEVDVQFNKLKRSVTNVNVLKERYYDLL